MKKLLKSLTFVSVALVLLLATSCNSRQTVPASPVVVNQSTALAGVNFDLQALGELALQYPNPVELEKIINKPNGINNLDLDNNGQVDFISVTQYGDAAYVGLQFKAMLEDGNAEIATIEYDKVTKKMNIAGNNNYYPSDAYYVRPFNPMGFYLFMGHPIYRSPYYYGAYGGFYSPYRSVGYASYSTRSVVKTSRSSTSYTKTTRPSTSKVTKPKVTNASKVATANATKRKEQLKKQSTKNGQKSGQATKSQKQFQKREASKPVNASGFSNKSKATPQKSAATQKKPASKPKSYKSSSRSSSSRSSSRSSSSRRSDMTFKIDVIPYINAMDAVNTMEVFTYNYDLSKDPTLSATEQIGFSAQQLSTLVPQVVSEDEKGLMVDYGMLVPVLVKALQEQQAQIDALKAQINQ